MEHQQKLNSLELKKAQLLSQLEMLSSASDEFYKKLGKISADIFLLKREMFRNVKNTINED